MHREVRRRWAEDIYRLRRQALFVSAEAKRARHFPAWSSLEISDQKFQKLFRCRGASVVSGTCEGTTNSPKQLGR